MEEERRAERIAQVMRGVEGAAAAVPPAHREAAGRAASGARDMASAARRLAAAADGSAVADADAALADAVAAIEALHFALLRVSVQGETPEDVELTGEIEAARAAADRLAERVPAAAPDGAAGERGVPAAPEADGDEDAPA